jgi:hypothetical protein
VKKLFTKSTRPRIVGAAPPSIIAVIAIAGFAHVRFPVAIRHDAISGRRNRWFVFAARPVFGFARFGSPIRKPVNPICVVHEKTLPKFEG